VEELTLLTMSDEERLLHEMPGWTSDEQLQICSHPQATDRLYQISGNADALKPVNHLKDLIITDCYEVNIIIIIFYFFITQFPLRVRVKC